MGQFYPKKNVATSSLSVKQSSVPVTFKSKCQQNASQSTSRQKEPDRKMSTLALALRDIQNRLNNVVDKLKKQSCLFDTDEVANISKPTNESSSRHPIVEVAESLKASLKDARVLIQNISCAGCLDLDDNHRHYWKESTEKPSVRSGGYEGSENAKEGISTSGRSKYPVLGSREETRNALNEIEDYSEKAKEISTSGRLKDPAQDNREESRNVLNETEDYSESSKSSESVTRENGGYEGSENAKEGISTSGRLKCPILGSREETRNALNEIEDYSEKAKGILTPDRLKNPAQDNREESRNVLNETEDYSEISKSSESVTRGNGGYEGSENAKEGISTSGRLKYLVLGSREETRNALNEMKDYSEKAKGISASGRLKNPARDNREESRNVLNDYSEKVKGILTPGRLKDPARDNREESRNVLNKTEDYSESFKPSESVTRGNGGYEESENAKEGISTSGRSMDSVLDNREERRSVLNETENYSQNCKSFESITRGISEQDGPKFSTFRSKNSSEELKQAEHSDRQEIQQENRIDESETSKSIGSSTEKIAEQNSPEMSTFSSKNSSQQLKHAKDVAIDQQEIHPGSRINESEGSWESFKSISSPTESITTQDAVKSKISRRSPLTRSKIIPKKSSGQKLKRDEHFANPGQVYPDVMPTHFDTSQQKESKSYGRSDTEEFAEETPFDDRKSSRLTLARSDDDRADEVLDLADVEMFTVPKKTGRLAATEAAISQTYKDLRQKEVVTSNRPLEPAIPAFETERPNEDVTSKSSHSGGILEKSPEDGNARVERWLFSSCETIPEEDEDIEDDIKEEEEDEEEEENDDDDKRSCSSVASDLIFETSNRPEADDFQLADLDDDPDYHEVVMYH